MSDAKLVNIARLVTTYNVEIEQLPDNLKCAHCKLVLKNPCQVPCGCTYCRVCIDDMMVRGNKFCPGVTEYCGESALALLTADFKASKSVSRLIGKCPHTGCTHAFLLANMEEHLQECSRRNEECPFSELGCTQDKFAAEEMDGHLQLENRRHSEILIKIMVNVNREIDTLKHELVKKDGQIKSLTDQMIRVQDENKLMKNDIKSIKEENANLANRVRILSGKIEREIDERRENDALDNARVIENVDREIAAVRQLIKSNKDELVSDMSVMDSNIIDMMPSLRFIEALLGFKQVDARYQMVIDQDVFETSWPLGGKWGDYIIGAVRPYKYRLASANGGICFKGELVFELYIHPGPSDEQLPWPCEVTVIITVADKNRREACKCTPAPCWIERPPVDSCSYSGYISFLYSDLIGAGINLTRGVVVSCVILPGVKK